MRNEETVEAIGGLAEQPGSSEAIDRRRPDSLLRMQNAALELLSGGGSLTAVLDLIARGFEAIEPGIHCTILLCDDGRLHGGVAPSLPAEYNAAVEGLAIGHGVGSCGHAAHTGRPMVVRDIASHPYWEAGRALALKHGLRACWSTPILSRDHEVLGVFAVYHEVPYEPRGSDFELVEAATHIAGIAIERNRSDQELQSSNLALVEADRRKDVFLAMLAHELRNPLAPLRTAQHLLSTRSLDAETAARVHGIIARQISQLAHLVDDLLDVSRITRGAIALRRERVTVQTVVARAVESVSARIEERRHHLRVSVPEAPAWMLADPTRLTQVVVNLLDNAAKYTEPGGELVIQAGVTGDEAFFAVVDNGMGMQREMLDVAFDLFTQADTSLARSQGGLGVGLALVRNLVEMHGGRVAASSPGLGRGCEFVVHIPLAPAEVYVEAPAERPPVAPRGGRKRVLVVDDNRDAAELLEVALAGSGYDVFVASDGPGALAMARSCEPEVALVDIGLPGIDGYEVARRLRAERQHLRLIAVTGYGQEADRVRARHAGFDTHLVKPVDVDAILAELAIP